jgi:hypothetical protein
MPAEIREFLGVRYYRYPESNRPSDCRYFKRSGRYLHRVVWEHHHGPIPPGHHVHHKDLDSTNNAIENLELVRAEEHIHTYHPNITPERVEFFNRFVRVKASGWHRSAEGRAWHRRHAAEQRRRVKPRPKVCERCGASYETGQLGGRSRFCSLACKAADRRRRGVDDVESVCEHCGHSFRHNKYAARQFCSRSCSGRARRRDGSGV